MENEFELFIREKRYVQNVSEHTVAFYRVAFRAFNKYSGIKTIGEITKPGLVNYVATMRESGLTPPGTDAYIRGTNPFLTWLFENELTKEHFKIKRLKLQKKVLKTFTDAQVQAIIKFKPKNEYEKRVHVLILTAMDTGARINELLTLERSKIDFDNCLMTVHGKGNKERIIPVSVELRKILYRYLKTHNHDLVFCSRDGNKLMYDNMRRNFKMVMDRLGITGFEGAFHALRRLFATNYIKENGNPFKLQRMLGHTTLRQTNEYVQLVTDDLSKEQQRTSVLNKHR